MNHDHTSRTTGSNEVLLTHDRRSDSRRLSRAEVWLLDEDLARAEEFGAVAEISRSGLSIVPFDRLWIRLGAVRPGQEWLVWLNDPSGIEPLADRRVALLRLERFEPDSGGHLRLACSFVAREVGRCLPSRSRGLGADGRAVSDVLAGDLLDELAQRIQRDLAATIHAEAQ